MNTINSKMIINGRGVESTSGDTFDVIDPAKLQIICKVPSANAEDVEIATKGAFECFRDKWSKCEAPDRGKLLWRLADTIESSGEQLAQLDSINGGRAISDCRADIAAASSIIRYFAGLADKSRGHTLCVQSGYSAYTKLEPYGVVAAIVPWNYPLYNACVKIAPALAAGNCCVLKPAEETPLSAILLASLALDCGFPAGCLNVITGYGETTGQFLVRSKYVNKISFTGSTESGRAVLNSSAETGLKPLTLELGGKSPIVVCEDADLDAAADAAVLSIFFNQGQTCTAASRLFVHGDVKDRFLDKLKLRASRIKVGDPQKESTQVGAVISKKQLQRIDTFVENAKRHGASVICGGHILRFGDELPGYFYTPTILQGLEITDEISQEEIFGPVLVVHEFKSDDQVIDAANSVRYGLAASIWTKNMARLDNFTKHVQAGLVWCNCIFVENPNAPVGGFKESGFGKEYGWEAINEYSRQKTIWLNHSAPVWTWA